MDQYREQESNLDMGNLSVGGEYFPIPLYNCITKAQIQAAGTVDEYRAHDVIGGCFVVFQL